MVSYFVRAMVKAFSRNAGCWLTWRRGHGESAAMAVLEPGGLALLQRLALAYAPAKTRPAFLALMLLDQRFAHIVSHTSEPLLAQMRLAWWRDELAKPSGQRLNSEPLLASIAIHWAGEEPALGKLIDGWEGLLADPPLPAAAPSEFAGGRADAFAAIGRMAGVEESAPIVRLAARRWALADLAAKVSDADERAVVLSSAQALGLAPAHLPRALRPLAVLDGIARASLKAGGAEMLQGRATMVLAMRLGLFGR